MLSEITLPDNPVVQLMRMENKNLTELFLEAEGMLNTAEVERRPLTAKEAARFDQITLEFDGQITTDDRRAWLDQVSLPTQGRISQPDFPSAGRGKSAKDFALEVDGVRVPLLRNSESVSRLYPQPRSGSFSIADFVRHNMGVGEPKAAVSSGAATVPLYISSRIIDDVRAASRIVQAGAGSIPITGPTNLAKITGDPTVYQHTEATSDVSESDMTLAAVSLDPKYLIAAVPLTAEIVEDSPNLDYALHTSLAASFAGKLDSLSLATILADSNIPTSATGQDPATWVGVWAAISAALSADQELPVSYIGSESDFIGRASMRDSEGSWVGKPPALESMKEYFTTKVDAGTAIFGDFFKGFAVAMRQDIKLEVMRWQKYTSGTHVLIAHARMDGVVLQPKRLFIQKETVA